MNNIIFRNAEIGDFEKFNEIYTKTTYLGENFYSTSAKSYNEFYRLVQNEEIIIMEKSEEIIGYSIVKAYDDRECVLKSIYILKEFQNQGLGRQFVNYIERIAKDVGMKCITLMSATRETDRVWKRLGYNSINYSDKYVKKI